MAPREAVGEGSYAQSKHVCGHVPAVGKQGHGPGQPSHQNLDHHCHRGQQDNPAGPPLGDSIALTEPMFMHPMIKLLNVHPIDR